MRLIDADAALDRYYAEYETQDICDGSEDRDWLKKCYDDAPTIDPESLRPKWISVEDRLPERGQEVIVYRNDCVYSMRFWDKKHPLWESTSHWMPLPKPPDMRGET